MTTKLDYMLTGCANGHPVRIQGTGSMTGRRLRFAVWPIEVPLDFDPAIALVASVDALLAAAAGLVEVPREGLVARTRADILGEGCTSVGTIVTLAEVTRGRGRLRCRAQLAECRVALEVGERLVTAGERTIRALPIAEGAALASASAISTSRGRDLSVTTMTRIDGVSTAREQLVLPDLTVARARRLARISLTLP